MKQTLYKIIPMSANEWSEWYESHKQDRIGSGRDLYQLPHSKQIFRVIRAHFSAKTIIYRVEKE